MLLLFGHVMLLGHSFFILLSEGPVQLSDCETGKPSLHATGVKFHPLPPLRLHSDSVNGASSTPEPFTLSVSLLCRTN